MFPAFVEVRIVDFLLYTIEVWEWRCLSTSIFKRQQDRLVQKLSLYCAEISFYLSHRIGKFLCRHLDSHLAVNVHATEWVQRKTFVGQLDNAGSRCFNELLVIGHVTLGIIKEDKVNAVIRILTNLSKHVLHELRLAATGLAGNCQVIVCATVEFNCDSLITLSILPEFNGQDLGIARHDFGRWLCFDIPLFQPELG